MIIHENFGIKNQKMFTYNKIIIREFETRSLIVVITISVDYKFMAAKRAVCENTANTTVKLETG